MSEYLSINNYGPTLHPSVSLTVKNVGSGSAIRINIFASGIFTIQNKKDKSTRQIQVDFMLKKTQQDVCLSFSTAANYELWPTESNQTGLQPKFGQLSFKWVYCDLDGNVYEESRHVPLIEDDITWDYQGELLPGEVSYPKHLIAI